MRASLVLCCHDFVDDKGFKYSDVICNKILYLNEIEKSKQERVIYFLDEACELFDREIYDYNKIANIIKILHSKFEVINEDILPKIQKFLIMYKHFGISLFLVPEE